MWLIHVGMLRIWPSLMQVILILRKEFILYLNSFPTHFMLNGPQQLLWDHQERKGFTAHMIHLALIDFERVFILWVLLFLYTVARQFYRTGPDTYARIVSMFTLMKLGKCF